MSGFDGMRSKSSEWRESEERLADEGLPLTRQVSGRDGMRARELSDLQACSSAAEREEEQAAEDGEDVDVGVSLTRQVSGVDGMRRKSLSQPQEEE